jgi:hypothetical protein
LVVPIDASKLISAGPGGLKIGPFLHAIKAEAMERLPLDESRICKVQQRISGAIMA